MTQPDTGDDLTFEENREQAIRRQGYRRMHLEVQYLDVSAIGNEKTFQLRGAPFFHIVPAFLGTNADLGITIDDNPEIECDAVYAVGARWGAAPSLVPMPGERPIGIEKVRIRVISGPTAGGRLAVFWGELGRTA